jgi:hypothetical protein
VRAYGLDQDLHAGLARCVDEQCEALLLHEQGEHHAGLLLGPAWSALRLALPTRRGELAARAVRDQLADLALTVPTLLERGRSSALHFWFATYEGWRQQLFPGLVQAYARWRDGDGGQALAVAAQPRAGALPGAGAAGTGAACRRRGRRRCGSLVAVAAGRLPGRPQRLNRRRISRARPARQ